MFPRVNARRGWEGEGWYRGKGGMGRETLVVLPSHLSLMFCYCLDAGSIPGCKAAAWITIGILCSRLVLHGLKMNE